ncbi:MAG: CGGC domain-containing protein [Oscillospiraceae bacterium]|nr:CGGC domain-containing protein [Oscillospiraceae bacterium]
MTNEKIGIITCAHATRDMDCCAAPCLRDLNEHRGSFAEHHAQKAVLAGMLSCAGCPPRGYPEKILRKVNALAEFDITTIHFSYCMVALCPFLNQYIACIAKEHPGIRLVKGTHASDLSAETFREYVRTACKHGLNMNDVIKRRVVDYHQQEDEADEKI